MRAVASEDIAISKSFLNEDRVEAPAMFQAQTPMVGQQGFLHGFLYVAEGEGIVESGDTARAELEEGNLFSRINGAEVTGNVQLNAQNAKTAILTAQLPGFSITQDVGSINYLFHFVVPISDGGGITMESYIEDFGGVASSPSPGDFATIQWSFKAMAFAYATTTTPTLPVGTTELVFGDYNDNGVVDAADYVVWRNTLGSTTDLSADGDRDGIVDQDDYRIWTLTFGWTVTPLPGGGSSSQRPEVPEPSSLTLAVSSFVFAFFRAMAVHRGRLKSRNQRPGLRSTVRARFVR